MYNAKAYSAASATSPLASATIPRRDLTEDDVQIEILFCGVCHSDLHQVRNEWSDVMPTVYPCAVASPAAPATEPPRLPRVGERLPACQVRL